MPEDLFSSLGLTASSPVEVFFKNRIVKITFLTSQESLGVCNGLEYRELVKANQFHVLETSSRNRVRKYLRIFFDVL